MDPFSSVLKVENDEISLLKTNMFLQQNVIMHNELQNDSHFRIDRVFILTTYGSDYAALQFLWEWVAHSQCKLFFKEGNNLKN